MDENWKKISQALDSELEEFDKFMTARNIDGKKTETLGNKEIRKIEGILERPLPDSFIQEKLLEEHMRH